MRTSPLKWLETLGPVRVAFLGSLLLSLVAVLTSSILNRDGMLYVETARGFLEQGTAGSDFDWQFLPILMALVSFVTRMHPETVGHLINALLLAGACALLVDLARRREPDVAWWACLVVLALPAFNSYRDFIIREFGYWFFTVLAFWLAQRWEEKEYGWKEAILCQIALAIAVLFRLESVVFYGALLAWQIFVAPAGEKLRRLWMAGCLPLVLGGMTIVLVMTGTVALPARVGAYLDAANLLHRPVAFTQAMEGLQSRLPAFSQDEAYSILLVGLLAIVPIKFFKLCGVFVVPILHGAATQPLRALFGRWPLLSWALLSHFLTLTAFTLYQLFVSARYVGMLNLLAVPLIALALSQLVRRFPRSRAVVLVFALVTMMSNVVSIAPGNRHFRATGHWLAANVPDPARVFVADQRIAYYAGWHYQHGKAATVDLDWLSQNVSNHAFDMLVLQQPRNDSTVADWIAASGMEVVQRFGNGAGGGVSIVRVPASSNGTSHPR